MISTQRTIFFFPKQKAHDTQTKENDNNEIFWTPGSTGTPKVKTPTVDAPRVVSLTLSVWRWKTGLTNMSTDCIRRTFSESGYYCRADNAIYKVAWPLF